MPKRLVNTKFIIGNGMLDILKCRKTKTGYARKTLVGSSLFNKIVVTTNSIDPKLVKLAFYNSDHLSFVLWSDCLDEGCEVIIKTWREAK